MRLDFLKDVTTAPTLLIVLLLGFAPSAAQHLQDAGSVPDAARPVRKICDPHTGMQWLLERDPSNQGGPGRMVLENNASWNSTTVSVRRKTGSTKGSGRLQQAALIPAPPVIRAGDRLVIEDNTPQLQTRLEAVALSSAAVGAEVSARLAFQGAIVRAVAVEPGRATMGRASALPRRP